MKAPLRVQLSLTRLPRELVVLYLVGPLIATPVLSGNVFQRTPKDLLQELATNYIAFFSIAAAVHALYRHVMPTLVARGRTLTERLLIHAGAGALTAAAVGLVVHPVVAVALQRDIPLSSWLVKNVVVTWTIQLPALVLQELRVRAEAAERLLLEQQQAALRAQLEAIQSRTNPHFLFNAMNTVASLIQDSPKRAERTLERLSDCLRYALHSSQVAVVPLARELAMVEDYLEVQRARFGDRLTYTFDVEPEIRDVEIPPLLLQPLVENAVLHGVAGRTEGGALRLAAWRDHDRVRVRIDDDGPGPGASRHRGTGTSLRDLGRRLELLFGDEAGLSTRANDHGGFRVELMLPAGGRRRT
jgi:two-component system sensor histidine kinase AlgZ